MRDQQAAEKQRIEDIQRQREIKQKEAERAEMAEEFRLKTEAIL